MSENTKIEWADHTFNPWEGCQKTGSKGCDHCYAETRNARFGGGVAVNWGPGAPRRRTSAATWALPKRWNAQAEAFRVQHDRRQRVFCASLADWLDNAVDIEWLIDLLSLIRLTPDLDWLLLSKRIGIWGSRLEAAAEALRARLTRAAEATVALLRWIERWLAGDAPTNVLIGTTVVDQPEAVRDIPKLLRVPARVHFLSMEPLLGSVDLIPWIGTEDCAPMLWLEEPRAQGAEIDWVIVGGESGPGARPMGPDWARGLRDQCSAAGVPFLFKQWGEWLPMLGQADAVPVREKVTTPDGWVMGHAGKKLAGRLLDGRTWDGVPE
ncbi:phage Gp37/Gp68 family protein [Variovorax sp. RB3P1]|uniref:phage Gp37/Gp68 family protein n=1 Tax=Variovorax sp. RB3P1 TaxID=3443732 RepID=UPI003F4768B9